MTQYLLFCGENYYPSGGMDDFRGVFPTLESAQLSFASLRQQDRDWAQIAECTDNVPRVILMWTYENIWVQPAE